MAEPFCGGAGASLSLLFREDTREIHINDADSSLSAFWWATLNRTKALTDLVHQTPVNMKHWRIQRDIYRAPNHHDRLARGFATFYLNRCNRSGIIMNGGPVGGIAQKSRWKLDARFNKHDLVSRLEKVGAYRSRIHLTGIDGLDFIDRMTGTDVFLFLDPPYYEKGPTLYLNTLETVYHVELAQRLRALRNVPWVLTYDDCPAIRKLYRGWAQIRPFKLRYAAAERRSGREVLIAPKSMQLPKSQTSEAIAW